MKKSAAVGDEFAADLLRGLIYTHNRANANTAEVHQAHAIIQAVVDLLVERGVLDEEALEARRQQVAAQLRTIYLHKGMAVALQEFATSKYAFEEGAEIDCENRLHLCHAACCKLPLALSREDVQQGVVRWELDQPYMLAHAATGYCVHMDGNTCGCTIYEHRPIPCRGYDCRKDKRIWLDFENQVVNPQILEPDWPSCLQAETTDG
jgi:hypothetical protein